MPGRLISHIVAVLMPVLAFSVPSGAQTPISSSGTSGKTCISPYFFGPNAFPVPELLDNVQTSLQGCLWADYFQGHLTADHDHDADLGFKLVVPLWSGRVNLSFWGQFREWYWDTQTVREARRVDPSLPLRGNAMGDAYISTDMLVLREGPKWPGITLRAAMKTASGNGYESARFYDSPGYFFDLCLFKNFVWSETAFVQGVRVAVGGGFLCWQTDLGRQNDATLVMAGTTLLTRVADLNVQAGGYWGWEKYHDAPFALKASLNCHAWKYVNPVVRFQVGLNDWPFYQLGVGLSITLDVWKRVISE